MLPKNAPGSSFFGFLICVCALLLSGCGGGGSASSTSGTSGTSSTPVNNVQPIVVDSGPPAVGGTVNEPFVTITICAPADPTNCQTIDHILVDTGSSGLRIMSSVLSPSLTLPQQTDSSGNAIAECITFADGYSWGSVRSVNLQIAGESANALPVQVIGDPNFGVVPSNCSGSGQISEDTVSSFGANGVLGVGLFAQDCGYYCVQNADSGVYYTCNASTCQGTALGLAQQVPNPITFFAADNNGVIISLPNVAAGGATSASGSMIFGVGTQSDNALGSATVYTANPDTGNFTTVYKGTSYPDSFLDSGSNGFFFNDSSIPQCADGSGFYCPSTTLILSAVNQGANGANGTVNFSVGSESTLVDNPSVAAFPLLAGVNSDSSSFDWGLPFFYGRNVYTVIEGMSTAGGTGPYFAY